MVLYISIEIKNDRLKRLNKISLLIRKIVYICAITLSSSFDFKCVS